MHNYERSSNLQSKLERLSKRNKVLYEQCLKKIEEIINVPDPDHYKNLMHDLKEYKRVQVGHFVLVFRFDRNSDTIFFEDFDHHDKIY